MNKVFVKVVHVVSAINGDQSEFWAAATSRELAAGQVQQALPPDGWRCQEVGGSIPKRRKN